VASQTGGIPSLVVNGETGRLLPGPVEPRELADAIGSVVNDPSRYEKMSIAARARYESVLNWERWGERVAGIIGETVSATCEKDA
jgi:alpha-maltose-1-phosphate synthase